MQKKRGKKVKQIRQQPRGDDGRFLSKADISAREVERLERLADLAILKPVERAKRIQKELRAKDVKREKKERFQRFQAHPERFTRVGILRANAKAQQDIDDLLYWQGIPGARLLPKPTSVTKHGETYEYIWMWQGDYAIQAMHSFLLFAGVHGPKDFHGYGAVGTGKGQKSLWAGTKAGRPIDIHRHLGTLMDTNSEGISAVNMMLDKYNNDNDIYNKRQQVNVWSEVKLTSKTKINFKNLPKRKS